ncbi:response regulator transcription factor [Petralouisia muris]|jgi:DNA-binding LytR/AlgR family response regulator|uniref:Response regulator transcription factor n=1 Tax=Petralouisia muris TaxID=3032872 RepID=A0AC61RYB0_9FIRM|nr:LytTR family DNA-binding domain-containing protein [Petralouisia muris]TGY97002.1 response regulator transcription factor [Petralouisia muris]
MVRIAVVEDDNSYVGELTEYLKRYQQICEEKLEITIYQDGDEITSSYKAQFDIILMDIQMKFVDGMTAAKEIREIDSEVIIIFITNVSQYAIRGYEVGALDYILKPVSYFVFSQKLTRAMERIKKLEKKDIIIQTKDGVARLNVSNVQYIESFDHNLVFHTEEKDFISNMTMKSIEKELNNSTFSRGNHCYFINLAHVDGIEDGCAVIKGKMLQISRSRKNGFMKDLTKYWGNER